MKLIPRATCCLVAAAAVALPAGLASAQGARKPVAAQKPAATAKPRAGAKPAAAAARGPASSKGRTPEQVAKAYLEAQARKDAKTAWGLLSASSRKAKSLDEWNKQAETVRTSFPVLLPVLGEALLVGGIQTERRSVSKPQVKGNIASVEVKQLIEVPTTLVMVKENGEWRVDAARSVSGDTAPAKPATTAATKPAAATSTSPAPTTPTTSTTPPSPPKVDTAPQCRVKMRNLVTAMQVYALDHDGRLPKAESWQTDITPYLPASPSPTADVAVAFKCPDMASAAGSTFAMNKNLSGQKLVDIDNAGNVVLLYETAASGTNQAGTGENLPKPSRHASGNVYAFADGTVDVRTETPSFSPTTAG